MSTHPQGTPALTEHTPAVLGALDVPGQIGIDVHTPGQCELPLALPEPPPRARRRRPAPIAEPIPGQLGFGD
jgi:hypothetical protein